MGDAAGQAADGVHFLGLLQLRLQVALLGDIAVVGDEVGDAAVGVAQRCDGLLGKVEIPALLAVDHHSPKYLPAKNGLPHLPVELKWMLAGF